MMGLNKKGLFSNFPLWMWAVFFIWTVTVTVIFNKYAYQIEEFDAGIRTFVTTGNIDIREFNQEGIPISYSPHIGSFISPFYVVHYGLMYSEAIPNYDSYETPAWAQDLSLEYWNVPPEIYKREFFKNCADWVVDHIRIKNGKAHLLYNFDWPYANYPTGRLEAPWWSGLTDSYAILLLLRAYDVYENEKYIDAATNLYKSVLSPVANGGSLNYRNERPWIEEYVDQRVDPKNLPFVFNGMVYATYGIEAYEKYTSVKSPMADELYESIADSLYIYDMGYWSYYDSTGNATNVKYHRISTVLLDSLYSKTRDISILRVKNRWEVGMNNAGFFWVTNGDFSIAKLQFLVQYAFFILLLPVCAFLYRLLWLKKG